MAKPVREAMSSTGMLAAVPAWKPGGGSARAVLHASGFLVLASAQVLLGIGHLPSVHVPLGVLMFALSVLALVPHRGPTDAPEHRADHGADGRG